MSKTAGIDPYGLNSIQLIQKICDAWGIKLTLGKNMVASYLNNAGFPLWNMNSKQACEWLANMTKSKG